MGYKSVAKKIAKKATKAVGKRYGISYGRRGLKLSKHSLPKVINDIKEIKERLNVEKKWIQSSVSSGTVAQVFNNSPGYYSQDITPTINLGTTENDRVGGSIKLTGFHAQYQFQGQTNNYQSRTLKICIIRSTDTSVTNAVNDLWDDNPLTGFRDFYSDRNYSNNPKAHSIIRTVYVRLHTPFGQYGVTANKHKTFSIKMNQITRFEGSANTPKDCKYFVVIFCDGGNSGSVTTTNPGILAGANNYSGFDLQEIYKYWYVDN